MLRNLRMVRCGRGPSRCEAGHIAREKFAKTPEGLSDGLRALALRSLGMLLLWFASGLALAQDDEVVRAIGCDGVPPGTQQFIPAPLGKWMGIFCSDAGHALVPRPGHIWVHKSAGPRMFFAQAEEPRVTPRSKHDHYFVGPGYRHRQLSGGDLDPLYVVLAAHSGVRDKFKEVYQVTLRSNRNLQYTLFVFMNDNGPEWIVSCVDRCANVSVVQAGPMEKFNVADLKGRAQGGTQPPDAVISPEKVTEAYMMVWLQTCATNLGNPGGVRAAASKMGAQENPEYAGQILNGEPGTVWDLSALRSSRITLVLYENGMCQVLARRALAQSVIEVFEKVLRGINRPGVSVSKIADSEIERNGGKFRVVEYLLSRSGSENGWRFLAIVTDASGFASQATLTTGLVPKSEQR